MTHGLLACMVFLISGKGRSMSDSWVTTLHGEAGKGCSMSDSGVTACKLQCKAGKCYYIRDSGVSGLHT